MTTDGLPPGWAWATLDEVCEKIQDGTHFSPKNQLPQGQFRYVTAKNVRPSGLDLADITYLTEEDHREIVQRCDPRFGDVLLVKDGVNTGDACINTLEDEISLLSSVCMLRPVGIALHNQYLRYYLLSPTGFAYLAGRMTGTAIKRIILKRIKETRIPVAPLAEQRRIVETVEELFADLDAGVRALERARANLKKYRAAVLKAAVEGRLTADWRHRVDAASRRCEAGTRQDAASTEAPSREPPTTRRDADPVDAASCRVPASQRRDAASTAGAIVDAASSRVVADPRPEAAANPRRDAASTADLDPRSDVASTIPEAGFFDPAQPVGRSTGGNLPHWRQDGVTYFVTFRLADSVPQARLNQWLRERDDWLARHPEPHDLPTRQEYHRLFIVRFERWLDAGYGACHLRHPDARRIVADALPYFDGQRYALLDWVVMPNHVHVLVSPFTGHDLSEILHSWKSYTSTKINRLLGRKGMLWQKESFDHIVRSATHLEEYAAYIRNNPRGLPEGDFSLGLVVAAPNRAEDPSVDAASCRVSGTARQDAASTGATSRGVPGTRQDAASTATPSRGVPGTRLEAASTSEAAADLLARILTDRRAKWEADQLARFASAGKEPPKNWQAKYPEPAPPDTTNLPALPAGWCWASVDQLAEIQGGIQKQPSRKPAKNAFPFLRVANVHRDRLDLKEVHQIELFNGELERLRLCAGDLLIVEGNGSRTEIGRSAIWDGSIPDCVHQNHIIRVRFLAGLPGYLNSYWNSPPGNRWVMDQAASTSGLYTLSVSKVSALPVPLPPLAEQEQIVAEVEARLSQVAAAERQIDANRTRAARLRQAILKRAFAGRLVPQDPADEPAAALLARLRRPNGPDEGRTGATGRASIRKRRATP